MKNSNLEMTTSVTIACRIFRSRFSPLLS